MIKKLSDFFRRDFDFIKIQRGKTCAETFFAVICRAVTSTTHKINEIFGFTLFEQLKPYNETLPSTTNNSYTSIQSDCASIRV